MTLLQSIQIILTLTVTCGCTFLIDLAIGNYINTNKWCMRTGQFLVVFHAIALPLAFINLIWSI
jgi:hypothetical protein